MFIESTKWRENSAFKQLSLTHVATRKFLEETSRYSTCGNVLVEVSVCCMKGK
jgi:hypothetical protein